MFQKMLGWDPALSYKKAKDTLNHESSEMMLFLALASLRSKYFRLVKLKMESGMEVLKKLEERPRAVREVNLPKTSGILPLKPFPSSLRCFRLEMLNIQRGKAELMMLYRKSNETRDVKFARGREGILPTLQLDKFNNEREGSMLIALNQSLASPSWTPDKSKCSKDESIDTHLRLSAANLLVEEALRSRGWIVKMKLLNMACFVVANYTFPGTAIFSLPRCKPVRFVYDGVFELDECSSFTLDAGCTASKVEAFHETNCGKRRWARGRSISAAAAAKGWSISAASATEARGGSCCCFVCCRSIASSAAVRDKREVGGMEVETGTGEVRGER
nr:hypothetical protein Iba_chr08dCG3920 [Ipomoea batatas]